MNFSAIPYEKIDIEASWRYPAYRQLSNEERMAVIDKAIELTPYFYPDSTLGTGGVITMAVIGVIGLIVSATATVVSIVLSEKAKKEASRAQAAITTIEQDTQKLTQDAATLQAEGQKKEGAAKIAFYAVGGLALIASAVSLFK